MDPLTMVLGEIKLRRSLHMQANFRSPWAIHIPQETFATFHFVYEGSCWVWYGEEEGFVPLGAGDLVVFPHGSERILCDDPSTPPVSMYGLLPPLPAGSLLMELNYGGEGGLSRLWGGALFLEEPEYNPMVQALPSALLIRSHEQEASAWFADHLRCIFEEGVAGRPGRDAIISRMSEVIFLHALRVYLSRQPAGSAGLFQALFDSRLGPALMAMHRDPATAWTVASLAEVAHMSRAAFARRFPQMVKKTPLRYLSELRLANAARLLRTTSSSVMDVALEVGYQSQTAFSTAFRKRFGQSPSEYRQGRG